MKNLIRKSLRRQNVAKLGDKTVKIEKITPRKYKELFGLISSIPNLFMSVLRAPEEEYETYLLTALEIGLDDFIAVVSFLTGIEEDYLLDKAGLDEITEYLARMAEHNNLAQTLKNVKSLLPKAPK
jgi:hypothetical protein